MLCLNDQCKVSLFNKQAGGARCKCRFLFFGSFSLFIGR